MVSSLTIPSNDPMAQMTENIVRAAIDRLYEEGFVIMPPDVATMTTYCLANGELIDGEFSFVTTDDFFGDVDDRTEIVKQVWVLQSEEHIVLPLCAECWGPPVEYWGLCEPCARIDDPEAFEDPA